jgi:hypothetical protein
VGLFGDIQGPAGRRVLRSIRVGFGRVTGESRGSTLGFEKQPLLSAFLRECVLRGVLFASNNFVIDLRPVADMFSVGSNFLSDVFRGVP